MVGSIGLTDADKSLGVTEGDISELRQTARKEMPTLAMKIGLPILTFLIGLSIALLITLLEEIEESNNPYPYAAMIGANAGGLAARKSSWSTTILISVVTFFLGLTPAMFGTITMYGVNSR